MPDETTEGIEISIGRHPGGRRPAQTPNADKLSPPKPPKAKPTPETYPNVVPFPVKNTT